MRACTILFAALAAFASSASPGLAEVRYFEDATLRAVQFVDANEGWAVGDEGAIWHTINGGKSWEAQYTGVRGSLRSVAIVTPFRGEIWVAGREELPHGGSVGVLLYSANGGANWQQKLRNNLPGLNAVRFTADPRVGFLLGDGCDALGSGVFKTVDAGRSWEPVPGPRSASWYAGEFANAQAGILCGAWSRLATFEQNGFNFADIDAQDGRRAILGLHVLPQKILAVGQGGMILSSVSGGRKWGPVNFKFPPELLANVDFHAIHGVGPRVWIVGRPGSVVLTSDDQGTTWTWHKTGQALPLHGLFFLDQRGWAVGEAGTILATSDGGKTWTPQRQGGKRAALLCIHARPDKVDVDTLARIGADEGYLAVALRCTIPPAGSAWNQAVAAERFAAGSRLAGAMTGETLWQFPLPQYLAQSDKKRLISYWNELHGGEADRQILRQMVLALRMWRPSVVLGDAPHEQLSGSPVSSLMCEALQTALVQASDPLAFPEQIDRLGLKPWRVSRYYAGWDKKAASVILDANKVSERLEGSFRDFASPASRMLTERLDSLPLERCYRLLGSAPDVAESRHNLLDGLPIATGEARRELPLLTINKHELDHIRDLSNFVLLAEKLKHADKTLAMLGPMLDKVNKEQDAAAALNVAHHFARQGQWLLAREAYLLIVQKYPNWPQSAEAYRFLTHHAGSSEARRRHELGQFVLQANLQFDPKNITRPTPATAPGATPVADAPGAPIAQVNYLVNPNEARQWYRGSVEMGNRLSSFGAMYALDPSVQFCMQSSRRQLNELQPMQNYFDKYVKFFPRGPWYDAANTELWLMGRGGAQAKPVARCRLTQQKPVLDGDFNDACWQGHGPLILKNAAGDTSKQYPTQAWMAYDQEFLYLALRCQHPPGMQVAPVKNRSRDAQLDAFDRVSIMLDLDRDYATYFHLQVDQRGCVHEDCWGDSSWNPKWFVAAKSTPAGWYVEAALPLHELTGERIGPSTTWACNVVRILPGRGVQAWSLPADVQPRPDGMGILHFVGN